ncbi:MAG: hypothetical protein ACLFQA_00375 [Bacteroidales bacterium]
MRKDYLRIGDKQYRVECNWNATVNYAERKGIEEMAQIDDLGKMSPRDMTSFVWACTQEGERKDGNQFDVSEVDLGGMMTSTTVSQFIQIYNKQVNSDTGEAPVKKKQGKMKMFGLL